jgi:uncharacterized protein (TIGR02996 family)
MTDTETALLAAIAAHPEEDTPRLMLADWLDENVGHSTCPACKGLCGQMRKRYTKGAGGAAEYWENCPTCSGSGSGTVPDDRADRAELIRVQVELVKWLEVDYNRIGDLQRRQSALIAKHPEWRPACSVCGGRSHMGGMTDEKCDHCNNTGRTGTPTRGFLEVVTVPTLATVLRRFWVCRRGTRHTTDMGICTCCMSREGQWSECEPTPWARDLVRHRDRWPLLREVRIADRVPERWSDSRFMWHNDDSVEPDDLPMIVFRELHSTTLSTPDAALAALGAAVWRVLVRLAGESEVRS